MKPDVLITLAAFIAFNAYLLKQHQRQQHREKKKKRRAKAQPTQESTEQ